MGLYVLDLSVRFAFLSFNIDGGRMGVAKGLHIRDVRCSQETETECISVLWGVEGCPIPFYEVDHVCLSRFYKQLRLNMRLKLFI